MEPKKKTNNGEESAYDHLQRKWLRLGEIIDLARGATDWPLPDPWKGRFKDLKAAVEHRELKCGHGVIIVNKSTFISLDNYWAFAVEQDALWDWLRDFCQRWRAARGIVLEEQVPKEASNTETAEQYEPAQDEDQPLDSEQGQLGRREQLKADTEAKYERWHQTAQELKSERKRKRDKSLKPIGIAKEVAKKEKEATGIEVNPENIKRRLNEHYPGWAG